MGVQYYPFTVKFSAPTIIRAIGVDPNSAFSLNYIPGSAIRGAVARGLAKQNKGLIEDVILSGKVRFLNAYPYVNGLRYLPTPKSYMKVKHEPENEYYNMAAASTMKKQQLVKSTRPFSTVTTATNNLYSPEMGRRLHNMRDRSKGRSHGKDKDKKGTMFFNEFIEPSQTFCGVVAIDEDSTHLLEAVKGGMGDLLVVGRSKRAGYGGWGDVQWSRPLPREILLTGNVNVAGDIEAGETFHALLLSEYVGRDPTTGYSDPYSLIPILEKKLKGRAKVINVFATTTLVGGYNRTWGLEMPQAWSLSAGSVIVMEAKEKIPEADLLEIEHNGVGLRKIEGFGRIAFLTLNAFKIPVQVSEEAESFERKGKPPDLIITMEKRLVRRALRERSMVVAQDLADNCIKTSISNSLIGRLRTPLRYPPDTSLTTLREWLDTNSPDSKSLRNEASRNLERVIFRLPDDSVSVNLREFLLSLVKAPSNTSEGKKFKTLLAAESVINNLRLTNEDLWNLVSLRDVVLEFLDMFLAALARKNKEE